MHGVVAREGGRTGGWWLVAGAGSCQLPVTNHQSPNTISFSARMTVRQKIAIALASAVLTLLVGVAALAVVIRLRSAISAVDPANDVNRNLENVLGASVDAETGQRGYVITGDSSYLGPYHDGRIAVDSYFVALRQLVADDPHQRARL